MTCIYKTIVANEKLAPKTLSPPKKSKPQKIIRYICNIILFFMMFGMFGVFFRTDNNSNVNEINKKLVRYDYKLHNIKNEISKYKKSLNQIQEEYNTYKSNTEQLKIQLLQNIEREIQEAQENANREVLRAQQEATEEIENIEREIQADKDNAAKEIQQYQQQMTKYAKKESLKLKQNAIYMMINAQKNAAAITRNAELYAQEIIEYAIKISQPFEANLIKHKMRNLLMNESSILNKVSNKGMHGSIYMIIDIDTHTKPTKEIIKLFDFSQKKIQEYNEKYGDDTKEIHDDIDITNLSELEIAQLKHAFARDRCKMGEMCADIVDKSYIVARNLYNHNKQYDEDQQS